MVLLAVSCSVSDHDRYIKALVMACANRGLRKVEVYPLVMSLLKRRWTHCRMSNCKKQRWKIWRTPPKIRLLSVPGGCANVGEILR